METGFQHLEKVSRDQGLPWMPGRLRARINVWRRTTPDSFVLSVIDGGYKISWNKYGAPPPREQSNSPNCVNHVGFIDSSIKDALVMGVVCETSRENLNNISPLNVDVKKSNGKRRLIFNATFINMFMNVPKIKYPQLYREGKEIFSGSKYGYVLANKFKLWMEYCYSEGESPLPPKPFVVAVWLAAISLEDNTAFPTDAAINYFSKIANTPSITHSPVVEMTQESI